MLNDGYRYAQPILRKADARKQVPARAFGMTASSPGRCSARIREEWGNALPKIPGGGLLPYPGYLQLPSRKARISSSDSSDCLFTIIHHG